MDGASVHNYEDGTNVSRDFVDIWKNTVSGGMSAELHFSQYNKQYAVWKTPRHIPLAWPSSSNAGRVRKKKWVQQPAYA